MTEFLINYNFIVCCAMLTLKKKVLYATVSEMMLTLELTVKVCSNIVT